MEIESRVPHLSADAVRAMLDGLPDATGYRLVVRPLRYRTRPRLAAETDFEARTLALLIPDPLLPFGEVVRYAARRRDHGSSLPMASRRSGKARSASAARRRLGKGLRFVWLSEGLTFREPREIVRFLYCHEWMHWYLKERLGRKSGAETACDRFALRNYLRDVVGEADAVAALSRERGERPPKRAGT